MFVMNHSIIWLSHHLLLAAYSNPELYLSMVIACLVTGNRWKDCRHPNHTHHLVMAIMPGLSVNSSNAISYFPIALKSFYTSVTFYFAT